MMKRYAWVIPAWLLVLWLDEADLLQAHWEYALVQWAMLALVPVALPLAGVLWKPVYWVWVTGACLALGFPETAWSAWLLAPYLLWAFWIFMREATRQIWVDRSSQNAWLRVFALGYWATGAAWAFFALARIYPFGFDPVITGLTAAHFHVAGFALSVIILQIGLRQKDLWSRLLTVSALLGMPLVALGITLTKLGYSPLIEWISAALFAGMALGVVWIQIRATNAPAPVRLLWRIGAGCLLFGAVLAGLYAFRFAWPLPWVNIPNMKIWHGTLNAVGFGWLSLVGWRERGR